MMTRPSVIREGDGYLLRLTVPQKSLIGSVLLFIRDRRESDRAMLALAGCSRARLGELSARINGEGRAQLSIEDIHTIYSALASICTLFSSEEDFYIKIGFFRENVVALANGLIAAVGNAESGQQGL